MCRFFSILLVLGTMLLTAQGAGAQSRRTLQLPSPRPVYAEPPRPQTFSAAMVATYDSTPVDNPITDAGATLGRVLFYDTQLSANHSVSCGSCHVQRHAFADPRPVSIGFQGQATDRNSMALNDLRFVRAGFFWDERAKTLEEAVMQPIFSHVEMGLDRETLVARLTEDERYADLFEQAFGTTTISEARVAQALSQFVRALESYGSKYDQAVAKVESSREEFPGFTASENLGKQIFFDRCAACHHLATEPRVMIFSMFRSLNNGVNRDGSARDGGRGDITFDPSEVGSFKASSLRNVEYTAPYMHDGRFATLEEVVEHYSTGVQRHPNLGPVMRFQFSHQEKSALVDFLKTLSDPQLISDPKFSDPWQADPTPSETAPPETVETEILAHVTPIPAAEEFNTWQNLLEEGKGIPAQATLPWLQHLDSNQDGQLSREEAEPIVVILQKTGGLASRSRTRSVAALVGRQAPGGPRSPRGSGRGDESTPEEQDSPSEQVTNRQPGDFDADGIVSDKEAADYQALTRFIEMAGGGRLEVFLDRFVARFPFSFEQQQQARRELKSARIALEKTSRELDLVLCAELAETLGPEGYRAFQQRVVDRLVDARTAAPVLSLSREEAEQFIWEHDRDQNQFLQVEELAELARALAATPGGFGQLPPAGIDGALFATRILQFDQEAKGTLSAEDLPERMRFFVVEGDQNGDGRLSPDELHEHVQVTAFERIVLTGIYIGGGFANTLAHSQEALTEIDLPESARQQAQQQIAHHKARLKEITDQNVQEQFQHLQKLLHDASLLSSQP